MSKPNVVTINIYGLHNILLLSVWNASEVGLFMEMEVTRKRIANKDDTPTHATISGMGLHVPLYAHDDSQAMIADWKKRKVGLWYEPEDAKLYAPIR